MLLNRTLVLLVIIYGSNHFEDKASYSLLNAVVSEDIFFLEIYKVPRKGESLLSSVLNLKVPVNKYHQDYLNTLCFRSRL